MLDILLIHIFVFVFHGGYISARTDLGNWKHHANGNQKASPNPLLQAEREQT
jgi:hypothetical protein